MLYSTLLRLFLPMESCLVFCCQQQRRVCRCQSLLLAAGWRHWWNPIDIAHPQLLLQIFSAFVSVVVNFLLAIPKIVRNLDIPKLKWKVLNFVFVAIQFLEVNNFCFNSLKIFGVCARIKTWFPIYPMIITIFTIEICNFWVYQKLSLIWRSRKWLIVCNVIFSLISVRLVLIRLWWMVF